MDILGIDSQLVQATMMLSGVVEARDAYTGGHLWRVAQYGKLLGQKLGLAPSELFEITLAGYVHDLGKIAVPDQVLLKNGPLTDLEFEQIKLHPVVGSELVRSHPLGDILYDVVRHHHERVDGTGYPDGIGGREISVAASVIGIADVFDALTSARPYRSGMPVARALGMMKETAGRHHPPDMVRAFEDIARTRSLEPILLHSSDNRSMIECLQCGPLIVLPDAPAEGVLTHCPSCRAEYQITRSDSIATVVAPTGRKVDTIESRPHADLKGIREIMEDFALAK